MADETLWQAVLQSEPLMSDRNAFSPGDTQMIVTLRKLRAAGVAQEELRGLLATMQSGAGGAEKIGCLRRARCCLLGRLHEQQQALDALDYYTDALKKALE